MSIDAAELHVPDRFESIRNVGEGLLQAMVHPVADALEVIDNRWIEMRVTRRGSMILLRGDSGTGKSTFLSTVGLFRSGVTSIRILASEDVKQTLDGLQETSDLRIVIIEGREALRDTSRTALEAAMHSINGFLRSDAGSRTLVVWPINTPDLVKELSTLGAQIGAESLFGLDGPLVQFHGPSREDFVGIASATIGALNEGASLSALGVTDEQARSMAADTAILTIGHFMRKLGDELTKNSLRVRRLQQREHVKLWILVASGNDSEGDIAGLTRGGHAYVDIDRLMNATGANIVQDLKNYPDTLGILGTLLDAKVIYLDSYAALSIARTYGGDDLKVHMRARNMSVRADEKAKVADRIESSQLGVLIGGEPLGLRRRGAKTGDKTLTAFESLSDIAANNDGMLNRAIGDALVDQGLITSYRYEHPLEGAFKYTSDLLLQTKDGDIRLEVMWRKRSRRAEIANYTLGKLANYAKALGLIS